MDVYREICHAYLCQEYNNTIKINCHADENEVVAARIVNEDSDPNYVVFPLRCRRN